jgi:hypothetical protein
VVGAESEIAAVCPWSTTCVLGAGAGTTSAEFTVTATAEESTTECVVAESVTWSSKLYAPVAVDPLEAKLQVSDVGAAQFTAFEYDEAPGASSSHW